MDNKTMYAITVAPKNIRNKPREKDKANQMSSLLNLVNVIYGQLMVIKTRSLNGEILDEIIERTEIVAYNIKHNHAIALSKNYLDDYQKDLWQLLSQLHDAEQEDGLPFQWEKHQGFFFQLFKHINQIVENIRVNAGNKQLAVFN